MIKDRSELENKIIHILKTQCKNKKFIEGIKQFCNKKIHEGRILNVLNNTENVSTLKDDELCIFTLSIEESLKYIENKVDYKIDSVEYFTETELFKAKSSEIIEKDKSNTLRIKCNKIISNNREYFNIPFMSVVQINDLYKRGFIGYDLLMQRDSLKETFLDQVIEKIQIFPEAIEKMSGLIRKGQFFHNQLKWNIYENGYEKFYYDEESGELVFEKTEDSRLLCIDGYNRVLACEKAILDYNSDTDVDLNKEGFNISIFNADMVEANKIILQENIVNKPIDKNMLEARTNADKYIKLANDINIYEDSETNVLYKKLCDRFDLADIDNYYTTKTHFADALRENFNIEEAVEIIKIKRYLVEFFNIILGLYKVNNIKGFRQDTVLCDFSTIYGFIYLAGKLYGDKNWIAKLETIIGNSSDLKGRSVEWGHGKPYTFNKNTKKVVTNYFDKKLESI